MKLTNTFNQSFRAVGQQTDLMPEVGVFFVEHKAGMVLQMDALTSDAFERKKGEYDVALYPEVGGYTRPLR